MIDDSTLALMDRSDESFSDFGEYRTTGTHIGTTS